MEKKKEIIFIGTYAAKNYLKELLEQKKYDQLAANQTEEYYIRGLSNVVDNIAVFSALVVASYPNNKYKSMPFNREIIDNGVVENVNFINLPIIRFICQIIELCKRINMYINQHKNESEITIIVYSMRLPYYIAAKYAKSLIPNAKCINIVPDVPVYMHMKENTIKSRLKSKFNQYLLLKLTKIFDGFVLYTETMRDIIKCDKKNSIVIEGIISSNKNIELDNGSIDEKKKIVMYAGGLDREYGVELLVKGFLKAKIPNSELHLYGKGNYVNEIQKISKENATVKYFGLVSPKTIKEKMTYVNLLVNPRPTKEEFTRYSCPSKTLEYMASGVPFLTTRLEGIPQEYFNYVYTIDDESIDGIANVLTNFFQEPLYYRQDKAKKAKEFILCEKNEKVQISKLIEFIKVLK